MPRMLVTEGKASRNDRLVCALVGLGLLAAAVVLFALVPVLVTPVIAVSLVLALGMVVRDVWLAALGRTIRHSPAPATDHRPSIALLVPCLNEISSLKETVPAMMELRYDGRIAFCYVCEGASTDGSIAYVRECSQRDPRVVLIEKVTPPAGRGAAVNYGLAHAPASDVVGFIDADHILGQDSLDELVRVFGQENPPAAVQGVCATVETCDTALARLLTIEREWLERVELQTNARAGGICVFGGGQGFFIRRLFDEKQFVIDEAMILDDIDLSCQMARAGTKVAFNAGIVTRSHQPETVTRFMDQRLRWARGWLQLAVHYLWEPLRAREMPFGMRLDLIRLVMTPFAGGLMYVGFGAAVVGLVMGGPHRPALWLVLAGILWPFLLAPQPFLAGVRLKRASDLALALLGIPALTYAYGWVMGASLADAYVLWRPIRYAKTLKDS